MSTVVTKDLLHSLLLPNTCWMFWATEGSSEVFALGPYPVRIHSDDAGTYSVYQSGVIVAVIFSTDQFMYLTPEKCEMLRSLQNIQHPH